MDNNKSTKPTLISKGTNFVKCCFHFIWSQIKNYLNLKWSKVKKFLSDFWKIKKPSDFIIIPIIIIMIVYAFVQIEVELLPEFKNTSMLKRIDTLSVFTNNPTVHNSVILKVLQEQQAIDRNELSVNKSIMMQIRLFYVAILAGLSSLLFRNDTKSKHIIRIVLLFLIILMYLLEVHLNDLNKRQYAVSFIRDVAIDSLVHLNHNDLSWFAIRYDSVEAKWKKTCEKNNKWSRKLTAAAKPNPEQLVFYIIPFGVLYIYRFWLQSENKIEQKNNKNIRKKKKINNKTHVSS